MLFFDDEMNQKLRVWVLGQKLFRVVQYSQELFRKM